MRFLELLCPEWGVAYCQMLMHPLWEIKQVINIDSHFCINWCNKFSGHTSKKMWSFISLVLWIAVFKWNLHALKCYVEDHFCFCVMGNLKLYSEYDTFLPADQVAILQLWNKIGLPQGGKTDFWHMPLLVLRLIPMQCLLRCPK